VGGDAPTDGRRKGDHYFLSRLQILESAPSMDGNRPVLR
jgi:hypothetical protein